MWASSLEINNIRGFENVGTIRFNNHMNILVGANNAGKSTIIRMLYMLQNTGSLSPTDVRIGKTEGDGLITLEEVDNTTVRNWLNGGHLPAVKVYVYRNTSINLQIMNIAGGSQNTNPIPMTEPDNFIYPYLSKRKVAGYNTAVNRTFEREVNGTLNNLVAKVDRLATKHYIRHEEFERACIDILGFPITTFQVESGKQAGIYVNDFDAIPLEAMGEGVPNILGLIANLCIARNKLFLIEEIENDVHPRALKSLLRLIVQKAECNQFVISTHSNIVTKFLGSLPEGKIHQVTMAPYNPDNRIPTATYREVGNSPEERREVLEDLGYELIDSDVWDGWLFLEESTAEALIVKYLIPQFVPDLASKVRTIATGGTSNTEDKFEDFYKLFLFTHLTPVYKNKAWVILDGDNTGVEVIERLRKKYKIWDEEHFQTLSKHCFEEYYPSVFGEKVTSVLALPHGKKKQEAKAALLKEVLQWLDENGENAKANLERSAAEVISLLKEINAKV